MFASNLLNNKRFRQIKRRGGFERMLSYEQYPEEKSHLWLSSFKKIDQSSWRTTRRNYKHIPQIVWISSRFRNPLKIHCYTCMSSETCWSRLIYMKLSSHRSFVINMFVITMAWHCISPWSFYRSLRKRREIDIYHIFQQISAHSEVKTTEKKRGKPLLNARKHWESEILAHRQISIACFHDIWHKRGFYNSFS